MWLAAEARAQTVQNKLADIIERSVVEEQGNLKIDISKLDTYKSTVLATFIGDNYWYTPGKTMDDLGDFVPKLPKITTSTAGMKLKKIAKL